MSFLPPFKTSHLDLVYFLGKNDRFIVLLRKYDSQFHTNVFKVENGKMSLVVEFKTDFLHGGGRYLSMNSEPDEFYFIKKPNQIIKYRLEGGELTQICKYEKKVPIHDFHATDRVLLTISNNLTISGVNVSSASSFSLDGKPAYNRDFKKVQELKILHNADDSILMISAHQYVDKTGSSYYGREKLFMYDVQAKTYNEVISYEGVLHDIAISKGGIEIAVTSGKMPSYTVIYNKMGAPYFLFAHDFKNRIFFSPNEELVAICGFGSLNGEVEIWNYRDMSLMAKASSSYASFLKWSFSSKFYLTATVVEKLKVDHKICLYTFDGSLVKKLKLDECDLINVDFAVKTEAQRGLISKKPKNLKQGGGLLGTNKRMPGKIEHNEIHTSNVRTRKGIKDEKPAPTIQIGESKGRFFNSKKGGATNKFKIKR